MASSERLTLRGFDPVVVRRRNEAHELAERRFTRLEHFDFAGESRTQLVSSGIREGERSICLVASTGHDITLRDDAKVFLLFPYRGTATVEWGGQVQTAAPSEMIVVGRGSRSTRLSEGYLGGMIQLPIEDVSHLEQRLEQGAGTRSMGGGLWKLGQSAAVAEAHQVLAGIERPNGVRQVVGDWHDTMFRLCERFHLSMEPADASPDPRASLRQVRMAEEFMTTEVGRPITLHAVARAAGASPRAIQLAFQKHRRCTPLQFLQHRRLALARSLLKGQPARSVTDVAIDCGFTHLSRFSGAYRQAFGESPSDTRRAAASGDRRFSLSG